MLDWIFIATIHLISFKLNPWRYSPKEPRPTEAVAARWQYRGALWLAKLLSLSFLNRISLLLISCSYPIVLTRLGGSVPDPIFPERFLRNSRESNPGPLPVFNLPLIGSFTVLTPPGPCRATICRARELISGSHKDMESLPGWEISSMPGPPPRQHKYERRYTQGTHSVIQTRQIWNDYGGQMIFGDLVGLKFRDICLTGEEKPRKKPHPGKLSTPEIEPGPAAWLARMLPPGPQGWTIIFINRKN